MFIGRLHRDERGSMSIVSVFAVMFLAMLLGMVMNAGRHVDGKLRMQNAADSAAYSGGVVLARGMNTLAFTNHLLCDIFATTGPNDTVYHFNPNGMVLGSVVLHGPGGYFGWLTLSELLPRYNALPKVPGADALRVVLEVRGLPMFLIGGFLLVNLLRVGGQLEGPSLSGRFGEPHPP